MNDKRKLEMPLESEGKAKPSITLQEASEAYMRAGIALPELLNDLVEVIEGVEEKLYVLAKLMLAKMGEELPPDKAKEFDDLLEGADDEDDGSQLPN